jgi:hypothetical protein
MSNLSILLFVSHLGEFKCEIAPFKTYKGDFNFENLR